MPYGRTDSRLRATGGESQWKVHTGYGVQARYLLPRFKALGYEVAQFAWYGLQGASIMAGDIRLYPGLGDHFGSEVIGEHVAHFKADLVISLQDIWPLPEDYGERCRPARWAAWYPVDHSPCPEAVTVRAKKCDYPVVYSRFGLTESLAAGIDNVHYIPHGVDTTVFKPGDKLAARQRLDFPEDAIVVAMVAANKDYPSRKAFPQNLQAFAAFRRKHPKALLYLHTEIMGGRAGVDMLKLLAACDIPQEAVRFVDQYAYQALGLPDTYMATVYQAADVLLAASMSEGFGIPIIEAQACGCPVITTDATSMPELTINGIATAPAQKWWTPMDSWIALPDPDAIAWALYEIQKWRPEFRADMAAEGVAHIAENYDWDNCINNYWRPFLARVEADIDHERHNGRDKAGYAQTAAVAVPHPATN